MFRCRFVSPLVAIATREGLPVPNAATLTMLPASDAEAFSRRLCAVRGPHGSTKVGHGLFSRSRPLQDSTCAQRASVQRQPRHCKPKAHFASSSHPSGAPGWNDHKRVRVVWSLFLFFVRTPQPIDLIYDLETTTSK